MFKPAARTLSWLDIIQVRLSFNNIPVTYDLICLLLTHSIEYAQYLRVRPDLAEHSNVINAPVKPSIATPDSTEDEEEDNDDGDEEWFVRRNNGELI